MTMEEYLRKTGYTMPMIPLTVDYYPSCVIIQREHVTDPNQMAKEPISVFDANRQYVIATRE